MTEGIFQIDQRDFKKLVQVYRHAPKKLAFGTSKVLNTLAFNTRKEAISFINRRMTVRSNKFVTSRIRVEKANHRQQISAQESEVGSVKIGDFTGWEEQEYGTQTKKDRTHTLDSRGGTWKRKVRPKSRLKQSNKFHKLSKFKGRTKSQRAAIMLRKIRSKEVANKPFLMESGLKGKLSGFKHALYEMKNKRIKMLINLDKDQQPKKLQWMRAARKNAIRKINIRGIWSEVLNEFNPRG